MRREQFIRARKQLGLTQKQVAEQARISEATVIRLEAGDNVGTDKIDAVAAVLGISVAIGEGPGHDPPVTPAMLRSAADRLEESNRTNRGEVLIHPTREDVVVVPVSDNSLGMGDGPIPSDAEVVAYVPSPLTRRHRFVAVHATGACLSPTINDGEIVVIDKDITDPHNGDILAIRVDGEEILRILAGTALVSYNGHEPISFNPTVDVIGVVVAAVKRFR